MCHLASPAEAQWCGRDSKWPQWLRQNGRLGVVATWSKRFAIISATLSKWSMRQSYRPPPPPHSLAQEDPIDRLRRHTKIVPQAPVCWRTAALGVGGAACVRGSECVRLCVCVRARVCPRGTLIGVISALPHDRCRLFTAETSMPTPAWVVNVRHH